MTEHELLQTTDAMVWAEEWCRIAREIEAADDGRQVIDEGWMVAWFANAIETGRDAGRTEAARAFLALDSDENVEIAAKAWCEANGHFFDSCLWSEQHLDHARAVLAAVKANLDPSP